MEARTEELLTRRLRLAIKADRVMASNRWEIQMDILRRIREVVLLSLGLGRHWQRGDLLLCHFSLWLWWQCGYSVGIRDALREGVVDLI
jgi:hypothetical protein